MPNLLIDLRQAFRSLRRAPGFLITTAACLALGIGANLAVISLVDQHLLRPLDFPHSRQLTVVEPLDTGTRETGPMTMADFLDLRDGCGATQTLVACTARVRTLTGSGEPLQVDVGMVTADFFPVLGVTPALGRIAFRPDEEVKPATVAILGHELWQSRFAGDPAILGRTLVLDGRALQVVGVLPPHFRFYERISHSQVFTPEAIPFAGRDNRGMGTFLAIGRLRPERSLAQARTQAQVVASRMASSPDNLRFGVRVSSLQTLTVASTKPMLLLFQGAVALLLLITCFNVAGLQLVRDLARGQELAIRQALGAGRWQLGRLFLAESLVLAGLGGAVGLGLGWLLRRALAELLQDLLPDPGSNPFTLALLAAALGLTLATGLGLALLSGFLARRRGLMAALRAGQRSSHTRAHWRVLKALVVAEVALSVVLLLGAGLLIRSLLNLLRVDPGFQAQQVLTVDVPLPPQKYPLAAQQAFLRQLEPALLALPGVVAVGVNDTLPFVKATNGGGVSPEPRAPGGREVYVRWHVVSPGYFRAMGIPLLAGAEFDPAHPGACMVSRRLAASLWPGQDPLGRTVYSGFPATFTVAGVVGDTAENSLTRVEAPQFYVPAEAFELFGGPVVAVRVQGDPASYAPQVKAVLRSLDLGLALPEPRPLAAVLREAMTLPAVAGILFFAFGALALGLSAVGLYGVLAQITLQRRREIGIRLCLGATRSRVVAGILAGAGTLVALGLLVGALLAWALSQALAPLLFGIATPGPQLYLAVLTLLLPAALLASLLPALRAAQVNPAEALRSE